MTRRTSAIGLCLALVAAHGARAGEPHAAKTGVVVELFTSQGCSSCPAADRLLSRLGELPDVIPLAFHVDYWNHLGWRDPFSSRAWSRRQERYASSLVEGRVYTPQAVIDGRTHFVGSDATRFQRLLDLRRREAPAFDLEVGWSDEDPLRLRIETETLRAVGGHPQLLLALVESGFETPVRRGENARRVLRNDHVVRGLRVVSRIPARPGSTIRREVELEIDPAWKTDHLRAVTFVQHPASMQIFAGASLPFP